MLRIKVNKTDHYSFSHFSKFAQKYVFISYKKYEMHKFYTTLIYNLYKLNITHISIMIKLTL